ncbi:hypothetical protein [Emticicia sp. 21SJ11W-3]|uniref:hypothetical protein n=1 Tax=Emticicia sp. 21SJ11W-3 TaxID=2916755 RepID=UPI00209F1BEB|nr:hypothetical protein [Emticicia sp. 21SJ11W-3]UTA67498.1 hypothetical protein MB380_18125 [Emticicia sp. 21SJ11W-3]
MYISFEQLPQSARIWIYQANRTLTDNEVSLVETTLQPVVTKWAAHGTALLASVKVLLNRFVIIALDESQYEASGCSIDASTRWFKELGEQLNVDFFDRSQAYLDGSEIKTFSIFQPKKAIESGLIAADTVVFVNNNHIQTLADLSTNWQIKASESYLKRFFNNVNIPA